MIVLLQVQDIICFIEYIQRGKSYVDQSGNIVNTDIGYPLDVKAVYLPGQRCYTLKQRNIRVGSVSCIIGTLVASVHRLSDTFSLLLYGFLLVADFVSVVSGRAFGKNPMLFC